MQTAFKNSKVHVMSWRLQWSINNPLRRLIHPPQKLFGDLVEPGMTILDIGCGTGTFTLDLAKMTGKTGRVIGVDVQAEALARLEGKAAMADLQRIVEVWLCGDTDMGELPQSDFALAFYMAHEVPDLNNFFMRINESLRSGGKLLLIEPPFHVSNRDFKGELNSAQQAGFSIERPNGFKVSRAALLRKG